MNCKSIFALRCEIAVGMRIIALRIIVAVPWIGAFIVARLAKPAFDLLHLFEAYDIFKQCFHIIFFLSNRMVAVALEYIS